jgi:hypothetical protein
MSLLILTQIWMESRTYCYPIKKMFIKGNELLPICDYNNKQCIVNAAISPLPVKSNHVFVNLIVCEKDYILDKFWNFLNKKAIYM